MNRLLLTIGLITLLTANAFSQITYLDLTGLTNTAGITNRSLGSTGTFTASMSTNNSPAIDPVVASNGDITFSIGSGEHCIDITFSVGAQLYLTDHTSGTVPILNKADSIIFDNSSFSLSDPSNKIRDSTFSIVPKVGITAYNTWNVTFSSNTSFKICGRKSNPSYTKNTKLPLRIGVITSSLPIELINFSATTVDSKTQLMWQTASELNNDYFTIERSANGNKWEELQNIEGAGTSNSILSYSHTDEAPIVGTSYYRLKQTDYDGQYAYSKIQSVYFSNKSENDITVFPNPTKNTITVLGKCSDIKVYNLFGQDVSSLITVLKQEKSELKMDLSNLKEGVYYIKAKTATQKVYKQ